MTTHDSSLANASTGLAALAVFSSRETADMLCASVQAALHASPGAVGLVDVLINGNRALAQQMALRAQSMSLGAGPLQLRVWHFLLGDKAHTWNVYVERLAPPGCYCFFVDGYASVADDALRRMLAALDTHEQALAATGVPTIGLGAHGLAHQLKTHGGIHGNLFALAPKARAQMRRLGFRLPLGLYRTDATIGSALSFGLDLGPRTWHPLERIHVCADAHWHVRSLRWWSPEDLRTHWRRFRRQAQGDLENAAVRHRFYVRQEEFGALPRTAAELVRSWAAEEPAEFDAVLGSRRFARDAYDRMMIPRDWSAAERPPELLADLHTAATIPSLTPAAVESTASTGQT